MPDKRFKKIMKDIVSTGELKKTLIFGFHK